jgi:ABC-type lipoprotein export system ATPase subunit
MIHCRGVEKQFLTPFQETKLRWRLDALDIAPGERVLVAGPSGCGKTTLLNLLTGLIRADAGEISIDGMRVDTLDTSAMDIFRGQHIGHIFQSFHLLAPLTAMENILLGARYGRKWSAHEAAGKAEHLLEEVGLGARKHYRPGQLSIGEQQRVAIARALINEPPVMLADEPTASLDTKNAAAVLDLLFALCREHGTTLVAVSHDPSIAARFDRQLDAAAWMRTSEAEVAYV